MSKQIDIRTVMRPITAATQVQVAAELKQYLDNGWTLFMAQATGVQPGQIGTEVWMVYVFVLYDVPPEAPATVEVAKRGRGRPRKEVQLELPPEG